MEKEGIKILEKTVEKLKKRKKYFKDLNNFLLKQAFEKKRRKCHVNNTKTY